MVGAFGLRARARRRISCGSLIWLRNHRYPSNEGPVRAVPGPNWPLCFHQPGDDSMTLAQPPTPKKEFPILLRQDQVDQIKSECERLRSTISQPHSQLRHIMVRQLKAQEKTLAEGIPQPFGADEVDAAVKREKVLREEITSGMPSSREMRRNMPGVVGR